METPVFVLSILMSCYITASGNRITTIVPVSAEYSDKMLSGKYKEKPIARYGFHRVHECPDFERSFICIRKCLDLDFDVAYADKNCICTCYKRRDKANYKSPNRGNVTKWRLGAPTTTKPAWAHEYVPEKNNDGSDDEINKATIHNIGSDSENNKDTIDKSDIAQNESINDGNGTISNAELGTNSTGTTTGEHDGNPTTEQAGEHGGEPTPRPEGAAPAENPPA